MNFEMIGKLSMPKATEKFAPYEEKTFEKSGWIRKSIKFNTQCGDSRHMLQVTAGAFEDGHGDVYTFSKATVDDDGNKKKGESLKIPFKDRLTSPKLDEVAEFKKFIFDLEKPGRRYKLEKAAEKIKEGTSLTDDELKELDIENEEEVTEALAKSKKKRHEFISEWDFVDFIKKVLDSGKYNNRKFLIRGSGEYSYSETKKQVYENYIPNRIYLAADDAVDCAIGTLNILFNKDSLDEMSVEEKGKYYVNGYTFEYDSNRKGNIPVPTTIVIVNDTTDDKAKKRTEKIVHKFIVDDDSFKEYGVQVNMVNGAQKTEITEDMLTDEQKDDLDCGLITMDDIRTELGGSVYGERIREYQFIKPARGWTKGRQDTVYTVDDMIIKSAEELVDDETDDLFDDDDDL